ncbi:hypothetical protein ABPG74_000129 [Tetrahymena malaccensis]
MGSKISVTNDTYLDFYLWFELLGGGSPYGGYYGISQKTNNESKIIKSGDTVSKGFTLFLILNVAIQINKDDVVRLRVVSPAIADEVKHIDVSNILQNRYCSVQSILQGKKYLKAYVYYEGFAKVHDFQYDQQFSQPFQPYFLFRDTPNRTFKEIDKIVG